MSKLLNIDSDDKTKKMNIMNIFINITTEALKRTFWTLTTSMGLIEEHKPIINMKSEFIYSRLLLTKNKKSYAGVITAELGKILSKPVLDMKGLAIRKTTVPKSLRKAFTEIVTNDVLKSPVINLKNIIEKYDDLGELVENSLKQGETDYILPKNIEKMNSYKDPSSMEQVRGAILWNALEPENQIIPPEKVNFIKLDTSLLDCLGNIKVLNVFDEIAAGQYTAALLHLYLNDNTCDFKAFTEEQEISYLKKSLNLSDKVFELIRKYPDKAKAIAKTVYNIETNPTIDISRFGASALALPKSVAKIPEYILPFIDYSTMTNSNMTNGYIILESLGIYCEEVKTTQYKSNIIQI